MEQAKEPGRNSERKPVFLNARCRKSSWLVDHVELANLSEGGCCIVGGGEGLQIDQPVTIRFADLKGVPGKVCWIEGKIAGVQFDKLIDAEVIAELADTYSFSAPNVINIRSFTGKSSDA